MAFREQVFEFLNCLLADVSVLQCIGTIIHMVMGVRDLDNSLIALQMKILGFGSEMDH